MGLAWGAASAAVTAPPKELLGERNVACGGFATDDGAFVRFRAGPGARSKRPPEGGAGLDSAVPRGAVLLRDRRGEDATSANIGHAYAMF